MGASSPAFQPSPTLSMRAGEEALGGKEDPSKGTLWIWIMEQLCSERAK
jgi:hypothetical protein